MGNRGNGIQLSAMDYRGDIEVLTALARGDEVAVVGKGGGMSCVISLGVLSAIGEAIKHPFKSGIFASGDAVNFAGFLSDPQRVGEAMSVYRHIACGGFLKMQWGMLGPYFIFDRAELLETLKGNRAHLGLPALSVRRIKTSKTIFKAVVTDHETGEGELSDVRQDLFGSLDATISIPVASCGAVHHNGRMMSDGAVGMRKLSKFMEMRAKYLLVIMNQPMHPWYWEWLLSFDSLKLGAYLNLWHRDLTPDLRRAIASMDTDFAEELRRIMKSPHVKTLVIYPTVAISPFAVVLPVLEMAYANARVFTLEVIEKARAV